MRKHDWTRVLGWPGYGVYRMEMDEPAKRLKLCDPNFQVHDHRIRMATAIPDERKRTFIIHVEEHDC